MQASHQVFLLKAKLYLDHPKLVYVFLFAARPCFHYYPSNFEGLTKLLFWQEFLMFLHLTFDHAQLTSLLLPQHVAQLSAYRYVPLLQLSGLRSPYPGKLGVVEEQALADLILVDGNPLKDLSLIANPDKNFLVIIKDGQIYKNTIKTKK